MYFVYIIYSAHRDVYYKGFTENLQRRLESHRELKSTYTSQVNDWVLVYAKVFEFKTDALKEEKRLKKLNRKSILKLIGIEIG